MIEDNFLETREARLAKAWSELSEGVLKKCTHIKWDNYSGKYLSCSRKALEGKNVCGVHAKVWDKYLKENKND